MYCFLFAGLCILFFSAKVEGIFVLKSQYMMGAYFCHILFCEYKSNNTVNRKELHEESSL